MKRFHVHIGVSDLDASVRFYSSMFGSEPAVLKPDYAKWMIDEPRLNFAISQSPGPAGLSHFGLEAESADELAGIRQQFAAADPRVEDEAHAACCYARSDKHWATDPQGIRWEGFHSLGLLEDEVDDAAVSQQVGASCCGATASPAGLSTRRCCG